VRNRLEAGGKVRGGRIKGPGLCVSRRQSVHFADWALCLITVVYPVLLNPLLTIFLCNSTLCPTCGCCKVSLHVTGNKPVCQHLQNRASKSRYQQLEGDHGWLDPHACSASDCSTWGSTHQRPEWGPQATRTAGGITVQDKSGCRQQKKRPWITKLVGLCPTPKGHKCIPMCGRLQGHWLEGLSI